MTRRVKYSYRIKENAIIEKSAQGIRVNSYFFGKSGDKYILEYTQMFPYPKTIHKELDAELSKEVGWWLADLMAGSWYYTPDENFREFLVGLGIAEKGAIYE